MSENADAVVIGIDVGTLSGRAVVVRVSDRSPAAVRVAATGLSTAGERFS